MPSATPSIVACACFAWDVSGYTSMYGLKVLSFSQEGLAIHADFIRHVPNMQERLFLLILFAKDSGIPYGVWQNVTLGIKEGLTFCQKKI